MAFQEALNLDCSTTITLGGNDKKTKKPNPTQVEGYFLGSKEIGPNKFNKAKMDYVHVFQTPQGNVGIWGKTDIDQKIKRVTPGTMVRITFVGTVPTNKGNDMLKYKLEVDLTETIDVGDLATTANDEGDDSGDEGYGDQDDSVEEEAPVAAKTVVAATAAERAAKVAALLGKNKSK